MQSVWCERHGERRVGSDGMASTPRCLATGRGGLNVEVGSFLSVSPCEGTLPCSSSPYYSTGTMPVWGVASASEKAPYTAVDASAGVHKTPPKPVAQGPD